MAPKPKETTDDIQRLLAQIDFSADNVVNAAAANPTLFVRAIEYRLQCLQRRNAAKLAWECAQADAELKLRQNARENGEKITERNIEALLLQDDRVTAVGIAYTNTDEMDEYSKLVVEAFRMRRDCLRIVGDMTRDEMSLQRAVEANAEKLSATRQQLRAKFPEGK
jgi:hypothetical protein